MKKTILLAAVALLTLGQTIRTPVARAAATIIVVNLDGAGEGFNDPTPWTPTGGNPATTLGQARLNAFQYAADIWGAILNSTVTIRVEANMDPLYCDATSAVLGAAGTNTVHRNFTGAPLANTWYPQALANSLAGTDLSPLADIGAAFNSDLNGDAGCLAGLSWYYGYDGNPPGGDIDFISVVVHEIGHGLGFQTFVNLTSGQKFLGSNDTYMVHLDQNGATPSDYPGMSDAQRVAASKSDPNLRWTGASVTVEHPYIPVTSGLNGEYVRTHAPNPQQPGSSVSHWSNAVFPNELMEPAYTGPNHDPSLAAWLMKDIGWSLDITPTCVPNGSFVAQTDTHTVSQVMPNWVLQIEVTNLGPGGAQNVAGTVSGGPGWLAITDANTSYGAITDAASSFGGADSYTLDLTGWPGGAFDVTFTVNWEDTCGIADSNAQTLTLLPHDPASGATDAPLVDLLGQNRPNPFNPSTQISYQIAHGGEVTLAVFDVSGKPIRTLVHERQPAGPYTEIWDGRDNAGRFVASGVYFYRLQAPGFTQTRRMVLLK